MAARRKASNPAEDGDRVGCWLSIRSACYHNREREEPAMGATRKHVVIDPATGKLDRRIFSEQRSTTTRWRRSSGAPG
jgi:hypothetical protein